MQKPPGSPQWPWRCKNMAFQPRTWKISCNNVLFYDMSHGYIFYDGSYFCYWRGWQRYIHQQTEVLWLKNLNLLENHVFLGILGVCRFCQVASEIVPTFSSHVLCFAHDLFDSEQQISCRWSSNLFASCGQWRTGFWFWVLSLERLWNMILKCHTLACLKNTGLYGAFCMYQDLK